MLRDFDKEGYKTGGKEWQRVANMVRQAITDDIKSSSTGKMPKKWLRKIVLSDKHDDLAKIKKIGGLMTLLVTQNSRSRIVRDTARAIVKGYNIKPKDFQNEYWALQHWIQNNIRYVFDTGEQFQTPQRQLLDWYRGYDGADCDCMTMLFLSLARALGHNKIAIGLLDSRGDATLSHAIAFVKLPKAEPPFGDKWIPVELTKEKPLGWITPKATKIIVIPIGQGSFTPKKAGRMK